MLTYLLSNRLIQGGLVFVVLVVVGSTLYSWHVERENAREKARTDKIIARFQQRNATPETPSDTASAEPETDGELREPPAGGQIHTIQDGYWKGGYWKAGKWYPPAGYVHAHPRGQTSSNPFFSRGVPEHLKCPIEYIGVYIWGTGEYEHMIERIKKIGYEVLEKYNPKRPIHEVWPQFIEDEKFYQANADIPPLDPERAPPGSFAEWADAPERAVAVDRIDWYVQHILDYPEIILLEIEEGDSHMFTNAWRAELGFDPPDWNVITLPDGREFREKSGYRYEFTYTEQVSPTEKRTYTVKSSHTGTNPTVVKVNLNETSDEELEALQGWDFSTSPYR